jgi:hypothetical protein
MKKLPLYLCALFPLGAQVQSGDPRWVTGSSQKVCQPGGELDHETGKPTVSQTDTNYGLLAADVGYSFEHNGNIWFLFGDGNSVSDRTVGPAPDTLRARRVSLNRPVATPLVCLNIRGIAANRRRSA